MWDVLDEDEDETLRGAIDMSLEDETEEKESFLSKVISVFK